LENSKELFDSQLNFPANSIGLKVVIFPSNTLIRGCIPQEQMFDRNDFYRGKIVEEKYDKVLEFNIGTKTKPRMVKIRKGNTKDERSEILDLIQ